MARNKNEIRSTSELPDWFSLEKYDQATKLDAKGWYENIFHRQEFYYISDNILLSNAKAREANENHQDNSLLLSHIIEDGRIGFVNLMRANPIIKPMDIKIDSDKPEPRRFFDEFYGKKIKGGVRSMTVRDLRMADRSLSKGRRDYSKKWIDQIDKILWTNKGLVDFKNWIDEPIYKSRCCAALDSVEETTEHRGTKSISQIEVVVNTDLPDSILIEDFKIWLESVRDSKRTRRPDFDKWASLGFLPFMDLTIWSRINDVSIPFRVMADAIFQPGEYDSETVRKTVLPIAMPLLAGEPDADGSNMMTILGTMASRETA